jgi:hypothetical protein
LPTHHHLIKRRVVGLVGACSLLSYIIPSSYHRIHPLGCLQTAEMSAKITVAYHLKKMLVRPGQRQYLPLGGLRMAANAGPDPSSGVACRYTCSMIRPSCIPYVAFPFFPRNKFKDKATCLESRRHALEPPDWCSEICCSVRTYAIYPNRQTSVLRALPVVKHLDVGRGRMSAPVKYLPLRILISFP